MPEPTPDDDVIELPRSLRWVAGLSSLAITVMVFVLMWRGSGGAGVVALVTMAGIAGLLALVGVLPTRLVIGGHEAHWRSKAVAAEQRAADTEAAAEAEVETIAEVMTPQQREAAEEAVRAARRASQSAKHAGSNLEAINDFERNALALLIIAAASIDAIVMRTEAMSLDERSKPGYDRRDAVVTRNGKTLDVAIMRKLDPDLLRMDRSLAELRTAPLLYISDVPAISVLRDGQTNAAVTVVAGLSHHQILDSLRLIFEV